MKSIVFVPVKDYIKSRKKLYVKFVFPIVVAATALAITLFFNFGDGEKLNAVFSEFISTQINIIAILISFSIAIITILVSADNRNMQELKNTLSNEKLYNSVNGKQLSLFQILLSNIAYNIISDFLDCCCSDQINFPTPIIEVYFGNLYFHHTSYSSCIVGVRCTNVPYFLG